MSGDEYIAAMGGDEYIAAMGTSRRWVHRGDEYIAPTSRRGMNPTGYRTAPDESGSFIDQSPIDGALL